MGADGSVFAELASVVLGRNVKANSIIKTKRGISVLLLTTLADLLSLVSILSPSILSSAGP
ncbi:MAG: hypothetical protein Alpg2KO_31290 [Alphaproteobacteria bacterium]